jgi:hypothetical protein
MNRNSDTLDLAFHHTLRFLGVIIGVGIMIASLVALIGIVFAFAFGFNFFELSGGVNPLALIPYKFIGIDVIQKD